MRCCQTLVPNYLNYANFQTFRQSLSHPPFLGRRIRIWSYFLAVASSFFYMKKTFLKVKTEVQTFLCFLCFNQKANKPKLTKTNQNKKKCGGRSIFREKNNKVKYYTLDARIQVFNSVSTQTPCFFSVFLPQLLTKMVYV